MIEDAELLRRYAADKSEEAFAELVRRRVDLVYSVALRQVGGNAHLAEDVTQKVFTDLARKAPALLARPALSGWLYRAAQFVASDVVRAERRRRARDEETSRMHEPTAPTEPQPDWDRLRPLLDQALGELNDSERDAIALRFFESRAFADIGRALQLTEEAARKRVDRALDKLAAILARRGVTSTTGAVAAALAGQAAIAAPAGLAAAVTGLALAGALAGGGLATGAALISFMASTKAIVAAGLIAAAALGAAGYQTRVVGQRDAELIALTREQSVAAAKLAEAEQRLQSAEQRALAAEDDAGKLLAAIQIAAKSAASPAPNASEPLTHDAVQARYRRAQELARTGDPAEALRELLWCFDTGMPPVAGFGGVRVSFLLSDITKLGEKYPPALAALRERRDRAAQRLLASENDFDATQTLAAINRYLKDSASTIALFDRLPAGDRRRAALATTAFDELRELRRYADAAEGLGFSQMEQRFEMSIADRPLPANITGPARLRKAQHDYAITSAAKNIEVLAGSGHADQARALAERVLAFDASADTRALLAKHAERAGHPDLLPPPKP